MNASTVVAMQWSKPPRPTRKVSAKITMICPVAVSEASTSQATRASSQPVTTALQNVVVSGPEVSPRPSATICACAGSPKAPVSITSIAKRKAPTRLVA